MVHLWNLELFGINRIFDLKVDFVGKVLSQSEVLFIHASCILVLVQDVILSLLVIFWNLQVTSFLNFVSGKSLLLHFREEMVDVLTYGPDEIISERNQLLFNIPDGQDVISVQHIVVRSTVFDHYIGDILFIDLHNGWHFRSLVRKCWPCRWHWYCEGLYTLSFV